MVLVRGLYTRRQVGYFYLRITLISLIMYKAIIILENDFLALISPTTPQISSTMEPNVTEPEQDFDTVYQELNLPEIKISVALLMRIYENDAHKWRFEDVKNFIFYRVVLAFVGF